MARMQYTAHVDRFALESLPPRAEWPELRFDLPELKYPARMNCATELLDKPVTRGYGHRIALRTPEGECTYTQLFTQANRLANVLVREMDLKPGNRVLLRGANNPMTAACWLAVMKAGGVCVPALPELSAQGIAEMAAKARVSHALCDLRLAGELSTAAVQCRSLREVRFWYDERADSLDSLARHQPLTFGNVPTAAEDVALIAFSALGGKPKATMHFHRDLVAMCDCFPRSILGAHKDDVFCGTPPIADPFGLGALLFFPLRFGASSVLVEQHDAASLLGTIERFQASVCFASPRLYGEMAGLAADFRLESLRRCVTDGAPLPDAIRGRFKEATGIELIDGMASSEMLHFFISHAPGKAKRHALGYAIPGYEVRVLDANGRPCPPGEAARLAVKGPTGCRYLADPAQKDYVRHGWNLVGAGYAMDEDGYFFAIP